MYVLLGLDKNKISQPPSTSKKSKI